MGSPLNLDLTARREPDPNFVFQTLALMIPLICQIFLNPTLEYECQSHHEILDRTLIPTPTLALTLTRNLDLVTVTVNVLIEVVYSWR